MFFILSSLLLFSTAILLYSGLFTASESRFLLTTPIPDDHIFAYKFQGALAFSNWGFLLLGSPVLIAFGLLVEPPAPWLFFVALPLFFLGFVLMPGAIGAIICLLLVNYLPRNLGQLLKIAGAAVALVVMIVIYRTIRDHSHSFQPTRLWFENFVNQLTLLSGDLLPNHWVAAGLRAAALGNRSRVLYYLALVWSNGLALYIVAVWLGKKLLAVASNASSPGDRFSAARFACYGSTGCRKMRLFPRCADAIAHCQRFPFVPPRSRAMAANLHLHRAAPIVFLGDEQLLERDIGASFKNGISLLTVTATSLLMSPTRPASSSRSSASKVEPFGCSASCRSTGTARLGEVCFFGMHMPAPLRFLITTCDVILGIPWSFLALHLLTIAIVSIGLSGISVSMGTFMPNFRETDPSKIAVGFGGTLNLVIGFLYILFVIGLIALPIHVYDARRELGHQGTVPWFLWAFGGVGLVASLAARSCPFESRRAISNAWNSNEASWRQVCRCGVAALCSPLAPREVCRTSKA